VHPQEYGEEETLAHGQFDRNRDAVTLPLIRACVDRGQPFLGICRGFQEVNVAMGGTLHPEIGDLPGRMNHRMPPDGTLEECFALRHAVTFTEDGPFHRIFQHNDNPRTVERLFLQCHIVTFRCHPYAYPSGPNFQYIACKIWTGNHDHVVKFKMLQRVAQCMNDLFFCRPMPIGAFFYPKHEVINIC
jgi:hypothetical protein